jgi:hypothetical protein
LALSIINNDTDYYIIDLPIFQSDRWVPTYDEIWKSHSYFIFLLDKIFRDIRSIIPVLSPNKEKKRPSVSTKCLLNIKSIVTQNVSLNSNNKNAHLRSSISNPPPLPLVDLLVTSKESIHHVNDTKDIEEKKRNKLQSNRNVLMEYLQKMITPMK